MPTDPKAIPPNELAAAVAAGKVWLDANVTDSFERAQIPDSFVDGIAAAMLAGAAKVRT